MREDELTEAHDPRVVSPAVEVELTQQLSNLECVLEGCEKLVVCFCQHR